MQTPPPPSLQWCLFLDVDGTLIELTDSPLDTFADAGTQDLAGPRGRTLGRSAGAGERPQHRLSRCTVRAAALARGGAARRRAAQGVRAVMHGASFVDTQLNRARAAMTALVQAHPGTILEDKGRTLAVHFRMAPRPEAAVREALTAIAKPLGSNYHIQEGSMVLEIKPRGFTKASAIKAFMAGTALLRQKAGIRRRRSHRSGWLSHGRGSRRHFRRGRRPGARAVSP